MKRRPDQVTRLLAGMAVLLMVGILVILVDLWLRPAGGSRVAQADTTARPGLPQTSTPIPNTPPPCTAPADWATYVVKRGGTLYSLAAQYGSDVKTLSRVNCLNGSKILVGQKLFLPGPQAPPLEVATREPEAPDQASSTPEPGAIAEMPPEVTLPEGRLNIVLLGADIRPTRFTGTWRTDAIVIVSVDTKENVVRLLHVPRDLWVNIPGHGYDRINVAEMYGEFAKEGSGADVVKQTILENLGIPIDYYVWMDFTGSINAVDTLGGGGHSRGLSSAGNQPRTWRLPYGWLPVEGVCSPAGYDERL